MGRSEQDYTQWPGFSGNGSDIYGLARNTGEVMGVFGTFRPKKSFFHLFGIDFIGKGATRQSTNFAGLLKLEDLVQQIGAPKWPWPVDPALVARGKQIMTAHRHRTAAYPVTVRRRASNASPTRCRFLGRPLL